MKTPDEMYNEGWCKDCDYCFAKCKMNNKCKGYQITEEVETDAGEEDIVQLLP